ncbi:DUF2510 domain-containing protein [Propionibacteriaceae bacterium Y1685]|uniref:DUF2510 domain-containing protein n=1 Tax=Microlunatus sp. Y1700 TaxID=3418487 RepID=UPI003B820CC9
MSTSGWYPDPGGQPGMYRFWNGSQWTSQLSTNPGAPPPTAAGARAGTRTGANPGSGRGTAGPAATSSGSKGWLWIVLGVVALIVVVAVIATLASTLRRSAPNNPGAPSSNGRPADVGCPEATIGQESPPPVQGGRVVSGKISYPALSAPFSEPAWDTRVPFGREVRSQNAPVEQSSDGQTSWVASALIARLTAGDGFYDPERGAERVADCVVSKFYSDTKVGVEEVANEAMTVDGAKAWLIESHLTFDVPGIETKGETMIIVVIDTGNSESGLFYGSIPDTSPEFDKPIRAALAQLTVDG